MFDDAIKGSMVRLGGVRHGCLSFPRIRGDSTSVSEIGDAAALTLR